MLQVVDAPDAIGPFLCFAHREHFGWQGGLGCCDFRGEAIPFGSEPTVSCDGGPHRVHFGPQPFQFRSRVNFATPVAGALAAAALPG